MAYHCRLQVTTGKRQRQEKKERKNKQPTTVASDVYDAGADASDDGARLLKHGPKER